jgi:hypothetical protein
MYAARTLFLAASAAFLLAACGDGPTTPPELVNGTMSFSYSGDGLSGSFSTSGLPRWDSQAGEVRFEDFAFGMTEEGESVFLGLRTRTATRGDLAFLEVEGSGTGTYPVSDDCGSRCAFGMVMLNVDLHGDDFDEGATFILLVDGAVEMTLFTATEARGTFSGVGLEMDTFQAVEITNGSFTVPIMTEAQLRARTGVAALDAAPVSDRFAAAPLTSAQRARLHRMLARAR